MKLILCSLAICLSILSAALTIDARIREESKRLRAAVPKDVSDALTEDRGEASIVRKLDALNAQLASVGRRLTLLEESAGRKTEAAVITPSDNLLAETRAISTRLNSIAAAEERLAGVPRYLAELTTYLDRSFGHLDAKVDAVTVPEGLGESIDWMVRKINDIDRYFTPLYAYLGLIYDPDKELAIADYPSLDSRINKLQTELESLTAAVADIRKNMMVPTVIEPAKHPH